MLNAEFRMLNKGVDLRSTILKPVREADSAIQHSALSIILQLSLDKS